MKALFAPQGRLALRGDTPIQRKVIALLTAATFSQFAVAWGAYFLATASPGPGVMAIIATSVRSGRQAGLALALGVLTGSITWAVLTCLGVSALIQAHPEAMVILKALGGTYLLWLAWSALKKALSAQAPAAPSPGTAGPLHRHYAKGYGIHLTNPKAVLAWIMLASLALPPNAPWGATLTFIGGCLLIGCTVFTSFALLFSIPSVHTGYVRLRRPIEGTIALLFGLAGVTLLQAVL